LQGLSWEWHKERSTKKFWILYNNSFSLAFKPIDNQALTCLFLLIIIINKEPYLLLLLLRQSAAALAQKQEPTINPLIQ
jgi:hypothetical protein